MFDPNTLSQAVEEAPEAGFVNINYGRLTVEPMVATWAGEKGGREKTSRPLKAGEQLQKTESLELVFTVKISEFNPALEFDYQRTVTVRKSSPRQKTDWSEIVLPSLEKVFGANWAEEVAKSPYVAVEDAPNIAGKAGSTGKVYGVPKFLARYATAAECQKARDEKFSGVSTNGKNGIPSATIEQVKGLIVSLGNDKNNVIAMLATKPYGDYEPEALWEAATS